MVASGRITPEEAARLRATAGTSEFDSVMAAIRARHAQVHTDAAVAAGTMQPEDAAPRRARCATGTTRAELRADIGAT